MNRKLKKELRTAFEAPKPTRKLAFLNSLPFPKATNWEFYWSQIGYISKKTWFLSVALLVGTILLSLSLAKGKEIVGLLSAALPLLTLIGITEIGKSMSINMAELEMSCKYDLGRITLLRLSVVGAFHFVILVVSLLIFKDQSQYGIFRYSLYAVTPFLLSSYLSFWLTNHIRSKETMYICTGTTVAISLAVFVMSSSLTAIYKEEFTLLWGMSFIVITTLLMKEVYCLLRERNEQWNFA